MKNLKCIIFDCDGVLVDSETIGIRILLSMANEHGFEMTHDQGIKQYSGRRFTDCLAEIENAIQKKLPDNFEEEFRRRSYEAYKSDLQPIKGAKEFVESLTIAFCVASSGPVEKIRHNLITTGFIEKFENKIFSAYQIQRWKPDPGIFLYAASEMGFSVNECIVIEDSIAGVVAAVNGGFKVFGYANENSAQDLENEGATVFYDYQQLAEFLQN